MFNIIDTRPLSDDELDKLVKDAEISIQSEKIEEEIAAEKSAKPSEKRSAEVVV